MADFEYPSSTTYPSSSTYPGVWSEAVVIPGTNVPTVLREMVLGVGCQSPRDIDGRGPFTDLYRD